jgi:adenylate kinase family enzyme
MKILFLKGLPGSGKSYFAKNWVERDPTNRVRINKDDLRSLLHQGKYSKSNEKQILDIEESIILDSLKRNRDIILDNTHLATNNVGLNINELRIKKFLLEHKYPTDECCKYEKNYVQFIVQDFTHVTPEECIKQDLQRSKSVGQDVIWRMYWDHLAIIESPRTSMSKKDAIIVDIDGTLGNMANRSPYDLSKVVDDKVRSHIRTLVNVYAQAGYEIIIVSGREDSCKQDTEKWLYTHDVTFDELHMRKATDNRKDYIIKNEIYKSFIEPNYNIHLVVDDRPQVIREWRRLGLNVINANPCDREF